MSSQASASLLPDEEASPPKGHGLQDVSGPGAFKKRAAESSVGPVFYSRLLRLFAIGFPSWTARSTVWTYGVCLVSILVPTVLGALVSTIIEPLQNAVIRAEYAEAMLQLSWISAALVICALLYTFQAYAGERIRLGWRQAIVTRIHRAYFRARLVYAGPCRAQGASPQFRPLPPAVSDTSAPGPTSPCSQHPGCTHRQL